MIRRQTIVSSRHPAFKALRRVYWALHGVSLPAPKMIVRPLLLVYLLARGLWFYLKRIIVCEPLFKAACRSYGGGLHTGTFIHWIQGSGDIVVGDHVTLDGKCSIMFAARYVTNPLLRIGDQTFIGHNCSFTVGRRIEIGPHCLISTDVSIRDCDGHPTDPVDRAARLPAPASEVRPVVVGANVWIGTRAMILKGVRIGDNSIVGGGAVVTKDVPANAIVAGNPARIVRFLDASEQLSRSAEPSVAEQISAAVSRGAAL